jgi:4-hydroxy-2-oxoglutarate aldolase
MQLQGIFAALTTPFASDGSVALDKFHGNIVRYNATGLSGYVVIGSTAESVLLNLGEIERIWASAREAAAPGKILIAGAGVESTAETIARAAKAAALGYDAALIKPPHYYKPLMTPAALERHYRAVADASPVPVILYSIPQYTGIAMAAEWVARLAEHPNIVGIKESSGNVQLAVEISRSCGGGFQTLVGSASTLFFSLMLGASGGVLALACCLPELAVEIYQATRAGDLSRASQLQQRILWPSQVIAGELGPAGVKYGMDCVGYFGGQPRSPLLPLSDEQKNRIESALSEVIARSAARSRAS